MYYHSGGSARRQYHVHVDKRKLCLHLNHKKQNAIDKLMCPVVCRASMTALWGGGVMRNIAYFGSLGKFYIDYT